MAGVLSDMAEQLQDWFVSVSRLTEESLFGIVPEGPHRNAIVLDVLKRNARILFQSELDSEGKLYSPLCFFLAAACRKLGTSLVVGHWRAALHNVVRLQQGMMSARAESAAVGLEIGSPAVLFNTSSMKRSTRRPWRAAPATSTRRTGRSHSASRSTGECAFCLPMLWRVPAPWTALIGGIWLG